MVQTITLGRSIQTAKAVIHSGDKIILIDAASGVSPKKIASRIVGKDLHIFAEGATESSAILIDYADASSVQVQGIGQNGMYYDYTMQPSGVLELSSTPVAAPVAEGEGFMSSAAWWGVGALAAVGTAAVLSGKSGGGTSSAGGGTTSSLVLTIADDETANTANVSGGDIIYTFTFSEAVKDFVIGDIVVTNGATKTFEKISDMVYTLSVTPTIGFEGNTAVTVASGAYHNATGSTGNTASSTQTVDMRSPFPLDATHNSAVVTPISVDPVHHRIVLKFDETLEQVNQVATDAFGVVINGDVFAVGTIGVSDNVAGMADDEVFLYLGNVINARGELFDWSNAGVSVTYSDQDTDTLGVIQDLAGNDATSFYDFIDDTLAPDAIITISDTILSSGDIAIMTVAFSEAVTNLDVSSFTVANGYLQNLASVNGGKTWTADLQANADIDVATNLITLAATYTDLHGNGGIGTTSGNYDIDTLAPILNSTVGNRANDTITFTFNEALSGIFADNTMFVVTDGTTTVDITTGIATLNKFDITAVGISGVTATISIDNAVDSTAGTTWVVTYTDLSGNDTNALQDIYGTDVSSFSRNVVI